jgi:hypothetical protein
MAASGEKFVDWDKGCACLTEILAPVMVGISRRDNARQREPKVAAAARRALHANLPAHRFDQRFRDSEAQPAPTIMARVRFVGAIEAIENVRPIFRRGAFAGVARGHAHRPIDCLPCDGNVSPRWRVP